MRSLSLNWIARLNDYAHPLTFDGGAFEVLGWAYEANLPDNLPHRHTYYEICLVGGYGKGVFTVGDTRHNLAPGTLFFARPGVRHRIQNTATPLMELSWVSFSWTLKPEATGETARLCREFARSEALTVAGELTPVSALWNALRSLSERSPSAGLREQIEGVSRALLIAILQAGVESITPLPEEEARTLALPASVRLAVRYLQDNLERPISVEETAQQVGVSSRHLARLFHDYLGVAPTEYLERTRLDRAAALLHRTDLPIKEIAARLGYSSVQYFSRRFQTLYATPPGTYREQGNGGHVRIVQKDGALM